MQPLNRQFQANAGSNVAVVGNYIWLKGATGAIQIKTDKGETAILSAGEFARFDKTFSEFYALDLSGAQNDVTFVIADGGEAGKYGTVQLQSANGFAGTADKSILLATATIILAANSDRNEAIITADSGNAALTRIGGSTVGAANGIPLVAGATIFLNTTAAIYGYSAAAGTYQLAETTY